MTRIVLLIILVCTLSSCSESRKPSHIVIQEGDNKYLFSYLGEPLVLESIGEGNAPLVAKNTNIIPEKNEIFIPFGELYKLANLAGGNFKTFDKKEKSFEGYAVLGKESIVELETKTVAGEKIGDTKTLISYTITDPGTQQTLKIDYVTMPQLDAIENCEKKSVTVPLNNSSNEFTTRQEVVVRLSTLTDFFSRKCMATYSREEEILYLKFE